MTDKSLKPPSLLPGAAFLALIALLTPLALAASSPSQPTSPTLEEEKTPEQLAIEHYNNGIINRDQAWKLEKKLGETAEDKRAKLEKKVRSTFQSAIRDFREATRHNPAMFQAYGELGYALRRTGAFEEALEAYDQALALEPNYTEAIEYRAEAYLALNRIDEAKAAYEILVVKNRQHAIELLEAMQRWLQTRKADPAGLSTQQVNEMEQWIDQRASTMSDTVGHAMPRQGQHW